jgi:hypothetical protein
MGGRPSKATPADRRLKENQTPCPLPKPLQKPVRKTGKGGKS